VNAAIRTLLIFGVVVWTFGALVALRINGAAAALAWSAAAPVCIVVGLIAFVLVAKNLPKDTTRLTQVIMALPAVRIVAAGFFGWLVVGFLPNEAQESFWLCLVAAYLATLAIETTLLMKLVRHNVAPVQGAA
jgi:hypothetical protein